MGKGSVTARTDAASASPKLSQPHDKAAQGLVVSGFNHLPWSEALFLELQERGGAWLSVLQNLAPITDADAKDPRAAILAFTCAGLKQLGLDDKILDTFSRPFREGMHQEDRLRRLGDRVDGKWQETVISGGPLWSGGTPERADGTPVHALLLLYDVEQDDVKKWADTVTQELASHRVRTVRRLALDLRLDEGKIGREHFGFADGISQPVPYGDAVVLANGRPFEKDPWHGVPLGEILLGHRNAHNEDAPGPVVPQRSAPPDTGLEPNGAPAGYLNFGLDGTYMVVRELRQDVAEFWNSIRKAVATIQAGDPRATHVTEDWLAERIMGRDRDGHLLCPSGKLAARSGQPDNDFGFVRTDPHGHGCPSGSHVRRANPRDGLAKDEASAQTLLDSSNSHRILRRGRKFGKPVPWEKRLEPDEQERGLLFICLNTDIERQFEFVQQTWLLNRNFATLFDESDPLVGPKGPFTIREQPLRRIVEVETFVKLVGGEYFFLPSLPALRYLAALPAADRAAAP